MIMEFPYGKRKIKYDFEGKNLVGVLESGIHGYMTEKTETEFAEESLKKPVSSPPLCELARGKKKIVLIASDHTRPVPSKIIIPPMLGEIRRFNPDADITILIATGCHRGTTVEELTEKFGEDIVKNEKIVVHDCDNRDMLVKIGTLPSGGECIINRLAVECDLLLAEGFIEPHFFAGFSGGRKSVLPGIASRETVLANHCSEFIEDGHSRTGVLEGNLIHRDMLWAAKKAGLAFVLNVVINSDKKVIYSVAGEPEAAHKKGCDFISSLCGADAIPADVVITTNGGYPLDRNVYQSVKGMTAGEATVREGGVIIMLASASDGHGGQNFYDQLAGEEDIEKTMALFLSRGRGETVPDQWQTQVFIRVLRRARVIFVSDAPDGMIEKMHMTPAHSIEEALGIAGKILGEDNPSITVIPDGVSVVVNVR